VNQRAFTTLKEFLLPWQLEQLLANNYFDVLSQHGRVYRVKPSTYYGVELLGPHSKMPLETLCAYPPGVPMHDIMLSVKLALEQKEDYFLSVANFFRGQRDLDVLIDMDRRHPPRPAVFPMGHPWANAELNLDIGEWRGADEPLEAVMQNIVADFINLPAIVQHHPGRPAEFMYERWMYEYYQGRAVHDPRAHIILTNVD
jgi:hypothetical protein